LQYLDRKRIRRAFQRAAKEFDTADFLHLEVGRRLLKRLDLIDLEPLEIADLGAGILKDAGLLQSKYPDSRIAAIDSAPEMLLKGLTDSNPGPNIFPVCADAENLPFPGADFDLVYSNLMLHWCPDPLRVLREIRRSLRFPGLFCFTTFGPDTLRELAEAWTTVDQFIHISPFLDMHDLGDILVGSGFSEPVVDRENITITYRSLAGLFEDLKGAGSINANPDRQRGLFGRRSYLDLTRTFESRGESDGRVPVTLEIIYGQAWTEPPDRQRRLAGNNSLGIPVEIIRPGH